MLEGWNLNQLADDRLSKMRDGPAIAAQPAHISPSTARALVHNAYKETLKARDEGGWFSGIILQLS